MTTESLKQRITAPRNLSRAMFFMRLLIVFAILVIIAFWMDYWLRVGKIGVSRSCSSQSDEIEKMADCMPAGRKHIPSWLKSYLVKYRYLTIAVLINMPGNYILGGGGGISIACGTSRRISWKGFLITIALAVSPVPLLAYLGIIQLEALFGV